MTKTKEKKFRIWWFSKAGKTTLKVILGTIIWFLSLIGIMTVRIIHIESNNNSHWTQTQWYFAPTYEILENIANIFWYSESWNMSNYKFYFLGHNFYKMDEDEKLYSKNRLNNIFMPGYEDKAIKIDEDFSWYEVDSSLIYLWIPYESKYCDNWWDVIYWDEVDERWNEIVVANKVSELKIEISNAKNYDGYMFLNNTQFKHFRQNSISMIPFFRSTNSTKNLWSDETACIIITPLNPITKEQLNAHGEDKNCEFWHISQQPWYDEAWIQISTMVNRWITPTIKVTPIEIEFPLINNIWNTSF